MIGRPVYTELSWSSKRVLVHWDAISNTKAFAQDATVNFRVVEHVAGWLLIWREAPDNALLNLICLCRIAMLNSPSVWSNGDVSPTVPTNNARPNPLARRDSAATVAYELFFKRFKQITARTAGLLPAVGFELQVRVRHF